MWGFLGPFFILGVLAWGVVGYLFYSVPPKIGGAIVLSNVSYFFLASSLALGITAGLIFYFIESTFYRKSRGINPMPSLKKLFLKSVRRGFLLSILAVGLTSARVFGLLNLINAALLIGIVVLIEMYFSSR
jgi:hypothetical protein